MSDNLPFTEQQTRITSLEFALEYHFNREGSPIDVIHTAIMFAEYIKDEEL